MTRRDYCNDCSNMVSDYDVFCYCCNVSICNQCVSGYDILSRLCILYATIYSHHQYNVSIKETNTLYEALNSTHIQNIIIETNKPYNDCIITDLLADITTISKILENYTDISNKDTLLTNKHNTTIINIFKIYHIEYEFKCFNCMYNIKK